MRKLIFMLVFVLFVCVTACASFKSSNKIGAQVEFDGGTAFCTYDQDVKADSFSTETTCSFIVKKNDVIYQCEKIRLSGINKDFKLETNCEVILDMNSEKDQKSQQAVVLSDFKQSKKVCETQNFYGYNHSNQFAVLPFDWG